MRAKKVKVSIKGVRTALDELVAAGEDLAQGRPVKKQLGVYFTSMPSGRPSRRRGLSSCMPSGPKSRLR